MLARVAGPVVSAQTWLAVIHLMAGVVTGALAFGVIVALALAMLGLPLSGWLLIRLQWHVNAGLPHPVIVALAVLLGLIVLPVAPRVTLALVAADTAVARYLIGPGSQADMSERIGELESSRARAVGSAEAERRRIERDLHDGAQQRLVSPAMNLGRARARFADDPEGPASSSTRRTRRPRRPWPSCGTWSGACTRRCWPTGAWTPRSPAWPR